MSKWYLDENDRDIYLRDDKGTRWDYNTKELVRILNDLEAKLAQAQKTIEIQRISNDALIDENLDYRYDITDTAYEQAKYMAESWKEDYQQEIAELKQQLADLQQEQIKEMQEHQEAMELADKTITNLVEDNRASQEWYKKQLADTEEQNKRVLEKLELIVSANQELEQKLAEKEKEKNILTDWLMDVFTKFRTEICNSEDKLSIHDNKVDVYLSYIRVQECLDIATNLEFNTKREINKLTHQHEDKGE